MRKEQIEKIILGPVLGPMLRKARPGLRLELAWQWVIAEHYLITDCLLDIDEPKQGAIGPAVDAWYLLRTRTEMVLGKYFKY